MFNLIRYFDKIRNMHNIKIKTEYLPERCEVCHKTEFYNPFRNQCSLCNNELQKYKLNQSVNHNKIKIDSKLVKSNNLYCGLINTFITGFVTGLGISILPFL